MSRQPNGSRLYEYLTFDPNKLIVGSLCRRKHRWQNQEGSLRYLVNGRATYCLECAGKDYLKVSIRDESTLRSLGICPELYYLGKLCIRGHEYRQTGRTLFNLSNGCPRCKYEWSKANVTPEQKRISVLNSYHRNIERGRERVRNYRSKNPNWQKQYRSTVKGKINVAKGNNKRRLNKAKDRVHYSNAQLQFRIEQFESRCVYCDRQYNCIDHFVPLSNGGRDCIENLVPACLSCNSSKGARNAESWYRGQSFFDEERWRRITQVLDTQDRCSIYVQLSLF